MRGVFHSVLANRHQPRQGGVGEGEVERGRGTIVEARMRKHPTPNRLNGTWYMFVCMQGGLKADGSNGGINGSSGGGGGGGRMDGVRGGGGGGKRLGSPRMSGGEFKRVVSAGSSASMASAFTGGGSVDGGSKAIGASHAPITRQGYLYKKGKSGLKNWQKRWFVLEGSKLIW